MKRTNWPPAMTRWLCILWLVAGLWPQPGLAQGQAPSGPRKPAPASATYTATPVTGLRSKMIWAVAFDPEDRSWIGTERGGARLEGDDWEWLAAEDGLADESVKVFLFAPEGRQWVGTGRGLHLFIDGSLTRIYAYADGMAASGVEDLALDTAGNLWVAHLAEGVSRFDGEQWQKFTTDDGLADNWVYSIALAPGDDLWFGTGAGASRFDGETWQTYTTENGLAGDWISGVAAAPDGRIWFATDGGVSEFDGRTWTTHLAGRAARALAVAADGAVWAAGSGFVSFWDGAAWHDVQPSYFDGQLLQGLALRANGEVWVASLEDGVTILTPKGGAGAGDGAVLDSAAQDGAAQDGAALWLGTADGVMVLAGDEQRRFDVADGLAGADVRAILIDSQGRKWFGTDNGASMYDGAGWTSYYPSTESISSNYVHTVAVDPQGRTWFAYGDRGLGVSVKDGDAWRQVTAADGLGSERVYSIAFGANGEVWLGAEHGVSQQNRTRWANLAARPGAPDGKIEALAVAPTGELWAGYAGGVAVYDGQEWISFGADEGLEVGAVRAIAFDADGAVWVGAAPLPTYSDNGGLFVYDGGVWTAFDMNRTQTVYAGPAAQPLGDWVSGLAFDGAGSLWVGTLAHALAKPGFVHGGVSVYRGDVLGDVGWTVYTPENGLLNEYVTALTVDTAGRVWVGTPRGLSRYDGESWTQWTPATGLLVNQITALAPAEDGAVWIATAGSGVWYFDGEGGESFTTLGLADRAVNALAEDQQGNIWFATAGGVSRFDGERWQVYTVQNGLAHNDNRALAVDGEGNIWAGGSAYPFPSPTLSRFDGEVWRTSRLSSSGSDYSVDALAVDGEGKPWAVAHYPNQFSSASALFAFDGENWVQASSPGPLSDDQVYAYAIGPDGRHWFGTDGSYDTPTLLAGDGESWATFRIAETTTPVLAITLTGLGQGWLGTAQGLAQFAITGGEATVTWETALRQIAVQAVAVEPAPGAASAQGEEQPDGVAAAGSDAQAITPAPGWQLRDDLGDGFQLLAAGPGASLWAAAGDRLLHVDGEVTETFALPPGLAAAAAANWSVAFPTLTGLAVDAQDKPWLATNGHGLYTLVESEWQQETTAGGLPADSVARLAFDSAGRLWAVFRHDDAYSVAYRTDAGWIDATPPDLLASAPRGLAATADAVWLVAGDRAPFRWQDGAWTQMVENWHGSSFDIAVAASGETVWVGNDAGWLRWAAGGWQDVAGTIPAPFSFPVAVDADGGAWGIVTPFCYWCKLPNLNENGAIYATVAGACRFTAADGLGGAPLNPPPYPFDPEPARPDAVRDIAVAGDGVVWFIANSQLTKFTPQGPVCPAR